MSAHQNDPASVQILMTAAEAFPVLETCFLEAEKDIRAGFRVFDLSTKLRSPAAQKIGKTWFDLVVHTLSRGVQINLIVSDFDPIARPWLHKGTWETMRALRKAAKQSGQEALLTAKAAMHPAKVGVLPRIIFMKKARDELKNTINILNDLDKNDRMDAVELMPGLQQYIDIKDDELTVKQGVLPGLIPASHHQKLAVFDSERLYIGGLDLNDRRYDDPDHAQEASQTWHDMQLLVKGPVAKEAESHLKAFENPKYATPVTHQLRRTLSRPKQFNALSISPRTELTEIADFHYDQVKKAQNLIYLETQFFRDTQLANTLAQAAKNNPSLGLILILPAAPEEAAFERSKTSDIRYGEYLQAKCVSTVSQAFGSRAFIGAPAQPRKLDSDDRDTLHAAPIIYVHAKVSIFDDTAMVSSANLNGRSFNWDTEAGVILDKPQDVQNLRQRCFEHWLPDDAADNLFNPETAVAAWRALADQNKKQSPQSRKGFLLPYPLTVARRFGKNLPGVPEAIV
ncbi:phospholipase D-like domain-containing protein [Parasulfitobacter algicola]|uniref:Phospholipase D n=1 Tax=Parasulfitobacter algicola TaxID=2614809 RepID=A0ABX2IUX9_9RHOB|nr:phospholipase D-like domain-containing protein [Sulfitobacter algicola]NSX53998.1 phospholipase [Sulfitobacter algicola]